MGRHPDYLTVVDATAGVEDLGAELAGACGRKTSRGKPCTRGAGTGTDHLGEGACYQHEGQPEASAECPLPLTELQRQLWEDMLPRLDALRLAKGVFWPNLYGLVVALEGLHIHSQLLAELARGPVKGDNGAPKKHPSETIINQRLSQVHTYMDKLGLTVAALTRSGTEAPAESELERLIRGR